MADWITVTGLRPYDGRYELDLEEAPLTIREWGWVKRFAGYLPVTLAAENFTDPEMVTVLAIVAIHRGGKVDTGDVPALWDRFLDAPFGSVVTFEPGDAGEEADADSPPAASSTGSSPTSGESSNGTSESPAAAPSRTGTRASDTSVSVPATSAT